ncbi:RsmB/NOP family class I SAM-dependent RNA methyltransferase [archaeon]|nr:RsmB/NOP family class I SAM-dependent RNA methyltransferase [archaeon]
MANKDFFVRRYKELGQEFKDVKLKRSLRVNTLKISHEDLIRRMKKIGITLRKISYLKDGYWVEKAKFSVGAITEFLLGYYYLQESASQIAVQILDPKENELILDACAAPGGKTTQISQYMNNQGKIIAMENKKHRMLSLASNLERIGIENVSAYLGDAINCTKFGVEFDKILLDAPCSGNFVTDKKWFGKRDMNGIKEVSNIQKEILRACLKVLKKDGILVYSTCTMEPEENELNMQWLIDNFNVKLEEVKFDVGDRGLTDVFGQKLSDEMKKCLRFWPWKMGTQAFFVAKVRKC